MTVRFASFNVENLFARPKAFNLLTWEAGRPIVAAFAEFNTLIALGDHTAADKARMIELLLQLEVYRRDDNGIVRRNRTDFASSETWDLEMPSIPSIRMRPSTRRVDTPRT